MKISPRARFVALGVIALVLIVATVITMKSRSGNGSSEPAKALGVIGPTPGPDSQGHIAAQRAYLASLEQKDRDASGAGLVSFSKYVNAARSVDIVGDLDTTAVFVTFPGEQHEAVPVTTTVVAAVAKRAAEVAAATREEIDSLDRSGQKELASERRKDLERTTPDCACVFAVAVQKTTVGVLTRIASKPEVRLVDLPRPLTEDLRGWQMRPLLPSARS